VIGAGWGRTGTASTQEALNILGFNCYHMKELFMHPKRGDLEMWIDISNGKDVDLDKLFSGYDATVDWPGCNVYHTLLEMYPNAKVVLNVRDAEKWRQSVLNTIYFAEDLRGGGFFGAMFISLNRVFNPRMTKMMDWMHAYIWQRCLYKDGPVKTLHGEDGKRLAQTRFSEWVEEVKRSVPAEQLLVFSVEQGWEPLCKFLEVPVPDKPFPKTNESAEWQRRLRFLFLFWYAWPPVAVALIVLAAYLLLRVVLGI